MFMSWPITEWSQPLVEYSVIKFGRCCHGLPSLWGLSDMQMKQPKLCENSASWLIMAIMQAESGHRGLRLPLNQVVPSLIDLRQIRKSYA